MTQVAARSLRSTGAMALGLSFSRISFSSLPGDPAPVARPMSLDDLLTAVRVADPQVSPDGRQVAFVRTTTDLAAGKRDADVWIVPADGSAPPRPLTRNEKTDDTPRFSPDGKTLAFISARGGAPQVYLLDLSGGEPRKLTDLSAGVQAPLVFSPDGKKLAFVSDVFPDCARRGLQPEAARRGREEPGQGPPPHAAVVPPLGRVARERPAPRLRGRRGDGRRDGRDAWRFRLAAAPVRRRRHRVLAGRQGDRVRLEPRRERPGGLDDEQRRLPRARSRRRRREAHRRTPRRTSARSFTPDGASIFVRAQRRADVRSRIAGTSISTTGRRGEADGLRERRICRSASSACRRSGRRSTSPPSGRDEESLRSAPPAGTPRESLKKGGRIGALRGRPGFVVFPKSTLTTPARSSVLPLEERAAHPTRAVDRRSARDRRERLVAEGRLVPAPESLSVTAPAARAFSTG